MNRINTAKNSSLESAIDEASECVGSLYPLTNFIACNALKGFEKIPFESAMRKSTELFGSKGFLPLSDYRAMYETGRITPANLQEAFRRQSHSPAPSDPSVDRPSIGEMLDSIGDYRVIATINDQMIKWCAAYLDRTQAQWAPTSKNGLFGFWRRLAQHDLSLLAYGVTNWSCTVKSLPENPLEAAERILSEFKVDGERMVQYLRRHVAHMPGFAGYLKWNQAQGLETAILTDYFAIRLTYEKVLSEVISQRLYKCSDLALVKAQLESATGTCTRSDKNAVGDYGPVWQEAYELNYRDRLLSSLDIKLQDEQNADGASCQFVCCIDVRSEPIRRELEKLGSYSTYGFAGFFGVPMRLTELGSEVSVDLCPVLLKPEKQVKEQASESDTAGILSWRALKASSLQLKKKLKCSLAGTFGLVELVGLFCAIPLALNTFFPSQAAKLRHNLEREIANPDRTRLDLSAFSSQEKLALAEGAIKGIGLTHFSKLIVLCGHKSSSVNNPLASSLDCGACGGNGGGFSAKAAAAILNDVTVREHLLVKGIDIPSQTRFIAAEHDTTTDEFAFFEGDIPEEHRMLLEKLKKDLATAGQKVREWRTLTLPASSLSRLDTPAERARDWAQTAPEWGLAGNAAFIAAPRSLSKNADLEGRVFLHSYEYKNDQDGKVLELIMTAPLVVAQWINIQYYLSTVDNEVFGSGSKVLHNVVGDFGVMQGAISDLKLGLPLQSLMTQEGLRHEPMRLLAVIRAPLSAIDEVLRKHEEVRQLVANRWIRLVALDPHSSTFYEAADAEKWRSIQFSGNTDEASLPRVSAVTP